jgi:phenylalanyl-tRNA synthetase alpha chain
MQEKLNAVISRASGEAEGILERPAMEAFKAQLVGPNGELTVVMKEIGRLPKEERPAAGKLINQAKQQLQEILDGILVRIEEAEISAQVGPPVDPTLPVPERGPGALHPLTQVREEVCRILKRVGFSVIEGSEVETEYYVFDALNTPPDHPARDLQDTFYLPDEARFGNVSKFEDERYLLRTHTSSVQIRTMLNQQPPLRFVSPGRCFRRDTVDATHSANFNQIEGLYVDKNVTVRDLKALLDYLYESLLGAGTKTRLRPHFFPYTEPSFEADFSAGHLAKVGSEWIEIAGCGMVDPAVFEAVGYDPDVYTGYAFGFGIERIAMILYGVDDIRYFYQNDHRFLKQFSR